MAVGKASCRFLRAHFGRVCTGSTINGKEARLRFLPGRSGKTVSEQDALAPNHIAHSPIVPKGTPIARLRTPLHLPGGNLKQLGEISPGLRTGAYADVKYFRYYIWFSVKRKHGIGFGSLANFVVAHEPSSLPSW